MNKIEFKRDKETGKMIAYKDGKPYGEVETMGDMIENRPTKPEKGEDGG